MLHCAQPTSAECVAERFNRTPAEGIVAMLHEAGLLTQFWREAFAALVYVFNCIPTHLYAPHHTIRGVVQAQA
jgi:hypothetical protein